MSRKNELNTRLYGPGRKMAQGFTWLIGDARKSGRRRRKRGVSHPPSRDEFFASDDVIAEAVWLAGMSRDLGKAVNG